MRRYKVIKTNDKVRCQRGLTIPVGTELVYNESATYAVGNRVDGKLIQVHFPLLNNTEVFELTYVSGFSELKQEIEKYQSSTKEDVQLYCRDLDKGKVIACEVILSKLNKYLK